MLESNRNLHYAIVLTGGIACGKSSVADILKEAHFEVVCADTITHRVLEECAMEIIAAFGENVRTKPLNANAESTITTPLIDRQALGKIVFSDPKKRALLESITHPRIYKQILAKASVLERKKQWYFLDIPLFFESGGMARYPVRYVVCVSAREEIQLSRLKSRNHFDTKYAKERIDAQMPTTQKEKQSTWILYNNGTKEELKQQVQTFIQTLDSMH